MEEVNVQILMNQVTIWENEFKRLLVNVKKKGINNYTRAYLKERLESARTLNDKVCQTHARIMSVLQSQEKVEYDYIKRNVFDSACDRFEILEEYLIEHCAKLTVATETTNPSQTQTSLNESMSSNLMQINLPKIDLPKFDGDYTRWPNFRDIFQSMIHENSSLPIIQKFQYLKACLTGEASIIVNSLTISNDNYITAWNTLVDRYENKRLIVNKLLNKLTDIVKVSYNELKSLKTIRDTIKLTLDSLKNIGIDTNNWDPLLIHILSKKFDKPLSLEFERQLSEEKMTTNIEFLDKFIASRINTLEALDLSEKPAVQSPEPSNKSGRNLSKINTFTSQETQLKWQKSRCAVCQKGHFTAQCKKFQKLSQQNRFEVTKTEKLCRNCLNTGHFALNCPKSWRCKKCNGLHHTLLHREQSKSQLTNLNSKSNVNISRSNDSINTEAPKQQKADSPPLSSNHSANTCRSVILATAVVRLSTNAGRQIFVRALIDPGSEASFISENAAQLLRVKREKIHATVVGIGGDSTHNLKHMTNVKVSAVHEPNQNIDANVFIMKTITSYKPKFCEIKEFPQLSQLKLADGPWSNMNKIDVLIGADYLTRIMTGKLMQSPNKKLIAQSTIFGWIVSGILDTMDDAKIISINHCCNMDRELQKFWELDSIPENITQSEEDEFCEKFFEQTTMRNSTGRFIVRLPFKSNYSKQTLGLSKPIALSSLMRIEKRLNKDSKLSEEYEKFMLEYETLGHMKLLTKEQMEETNRIYIPHHPVVKLSNEAMKLRVVFNASCNTSSSIFLNDILHIGPKLQLDITQIIINWRAFRYVCTTDIVKMYRQILVHEADKKFQNILWRSDIEKDIRAFELQTVTYGLAPAPFLALRTIKELVNIYENEFPMAAEILKTSIYVDDIIFGAHEVKQLMETKTQIIDIMKKGQFELSKWSSNLDKEETEINKLNLIKTETSTKILGLIWSPINDSFSFEIHTELIQKITKRNLLSVIARIYDPMGWLSPVMVVAKQMLQWLWLKKVNWDEEITGTLRSKWDIFYSQLPLLNSIKISRWDKFYNEENAIELIGFCDASQLSYSAVVYSRLTHENGRKQIILMMAKTKVAPLKTISIPRLELCAAVLLTKLIIHIRRILNRKISDITCFSDSQITLAWIAKHPSNWKIFIANRVSYIQTNLPEAKWKYISTKQNPADLNSRGISAHEFVNITYWWKGPQFLLKDNSILTEKQYGTNMEIRKTILNANVDEIQENEIFYKYSSWPKLLRILSFVFRFYHVLKSKKRGKEEYLHPHEINSTNSTIFKIYSFLHFKNTS